MNLHSIIRCLTEAKISFALEHNRDDAISIIASVPGERWEIDVFDDGTVDFEVFSSGGEIHGLELLREKIGQFSDSA